jgi:PhnB protein
MARKTTKAKAKPKAKARPKAKAKTAPKRKPAASGRAAAKRMRPAARIAKPSQPKWLPAGFGQVTPYLTVADANGAMAFYTKAFGAKELVRMPMGGKIMHAELAIGQARIMLSDAMPEMGGAPAPSGDSPVTVHLYVADTDATVSRAEAAGATVLAAPSDMFWGDRFAKVRDPFGHSWSIATHVRDVTPAEMEEAMKKMGQ